ncbi:hypothetical protein Ddye_019127 [Dipteronia dyeriana]|uniref:DUF4283 domain-containing protein n=1 Tax=Dipteronia dyeriana TaxID=168575 RepID=A0AAD9TXQ3_9ROSI|nr:hypothetical protein Ddye_019127 [Dipteronia dyeriana]
MVSYWARQLTDLEEGYFVARFQMKDDLDYVLTNRPWVISNQYLVVQRWKPNFVPGEDLIQSMSTWVRFSKLPMEWLDADLLWNIGGMLGRMCKVDLSIVNQARARFARICMEIDISKPLLGVLHIEDRTIKKISADKDKSPYGPWILVSYGKQGHKNHNGRFNRNGNFTSGVVENMGGVGKTIDSGSMKKSNGGSAEINLWKIPPSKSGVKISSTIPRNTTSSSRGSGSRFEVLNDDVDIMMTEGDLQNSNQGGDDANHKGKVVLMEVTNDFVLLANKSTRNFSEGSKNNQKNGELLATNKGITSKVAEYRRVNAISRVNIPTISLLSNVIEEEDSDSASVLRNLHREVTGFITQSVAHMETNKGLNRKELSSSASYMVSRYFNSVLSAVLQLHNRILVSPDPVPENYTDERWKRFKTCLGALDETYIRVHVPEVSKPRFITRKGEIATNVLGACSRDMLFTFVFPGWEGSASNS